MLELIGTITLIAIGVWGFFIFLGMQMIKKSTATVEQFVHLLNGFSISQGVSGERERADNSTVMAMMLQDALDSVRSGILTHPLTVQSQMDALSAFINNPQGLVAVYGEKNSHLIPPCIQALKTVRDRLITIARQH